MSEAEDQALIDAVNTVSGSSLTVIGRAAAGTSGGAIFVDLDDGSPGVVTRFLGTEDHANQTALIMARIKALGLPVPTHHRVVAVDHDIFLVQERLPGIPPTTVTPAVIDAVVEVNDRFARVLVDEPGVPTLPLCLSRSGHPYPRHEILAEHSPRSRRILDAIRSVALPERDDPAGDDLHHVDLDLSNVLFAPDGTVSGVVDWNLGVYRGDRHRALVKTRFEQEWALHAPTPQHAHVEAAEHLDRLLEQRIAAPELRRFWASRLLYQLHWILQSGPPEVVDWHLTVAEQRLLG